MKIETRDDLLSTIAEAIELEHNLMRLYAAFSLKQSTTQGVSPAELVNYEVAEGDPGNCGSRNDLSRISD
jgi:hypothetical protein